MDRSLSLSRSLHISRLLLTHPETGEHMHTCGNHPSTFFVHWSNSNRPPSGYWSNSLTSRPHTSAHTHEHTHTHTPTRYHAISCSCAQMLIYWIVSQSTMVRLSSCCTERNVNQCILNGSVPLMFPCYTERNVNQCILNGSVYQTRKRERVCADSTVHTLVI